MAGVRKVLRSALVILLSSLLVSACGGSSSSRTIERAQNEPTQNVGDPPATVSLSASNAVVSAGDSVTLTWASSDATSCSASGGWTGTRPLSGSELIGPLNQDTSFTLSCSGSGGGGVRQVDVQIDQGNGASLNFSATPLQIASGGSSTLSWDSSDSNSCTASGGWSGSQSVSGTFTVGPISSTTSYQLSCDGPSGTAIGMVTIEVVDKTLRWQAPTQNVDGSTLDDLAGYVIYWGTSSRNYIGSHTINSSTTTEWEATVATGNYYFAMTAFDADDNQSGYSNEVLKFIP